MAALLVSLSVMGLMMSMALPVWSHAAKREREAELIFRGEQYARAIVLYQRRVAGAFPADIDTLVEQRFLRRLYTDPMTEDGEFQLIYQVQASQMQGGPATAATPGQQTDPAVQPGQSGSALGGAFGQVVPGAGSTPGGVQGGIIGVVSKSTEASIRLYNGRGNYNEWAFIPVATSTQPGAVPGGGPAGAGQPGQLFQQPGQNGQRGFGLGGGGQNRGGFGGDARGARPACG